MKIIDAHVHYALPINPNDLIKTIEKTGATSCNLVLVPDKKFFSATPDALMIKHMTGNNYYVFTNLDVTNYFLHSKTLGKHFVSYVKKMLKCGCDGVKIIEGKPSIRRTLPVPNWDEKVWEPFFKYAEKTNLPILWHVNDPEEYWDKNNVSAIAKMNGWFYSTKDINNIEQYNQVFRLLEKFPKLNICFAHFFFFSKNLNKLDELMTRFTNIKIDLTPGIEMYKNLSIDKNKTLKFFKKYQDRIIYGSDICARNVISDNKSINHNESQLRAEYVQYFIKENKKKMINSDDDFLIGVPKFIMNPLNLENDIQEKIFHINFENFVKNHNKVNVRKTLKETYRIKTIIKIFSIKNKDKNPDYSHVNYVIKYFKEK